MQVPACLLAISFQQLDGTMEQSKVDVADAETSRRLALAIREELQCVLNLLLLFIHGGNTAELPLVNL